MAEHPVASGGVLDAPVDSQSQDDLVERVLAFMQDGLAGNRLVDGTIWGVVLAVARAYPLQFSPTVERAAAAAEAPGGVPREQAFVLQATADGSLPQLLLKVQAQPQIASAYARGAPMRDKGAVTKFAAELQALQQAAGGAQPGPPAGQPAASSAPEPRAVPGAGTQQQAAAPVPQPIRIQTEADAQAAMAAATDSSLPALASATAGLAAAQLQQLLAQQQSALRGHVSKVAAGWTSLVGGMGAAPAAGPASGSPTLPPAPPHAPLVTATLAMGSSAERPVSLTLAPAIAPAAPAAQAVGLGAAGAAAAAEAEPKARLLPGATASATAAAASAVEHGLAAVMALSVRVRREPSSDTAAAAAAPAKGGGSSTPQQQRTPAAAAGGGGGGGGVAAAMAAGGGWLSARLGSFRDRAASGSDDGAAPLASHASANAGRSSSEGLAVRLLVRQPGDPGAAERPVQLQLLAGGAAAGDASSSGSGRAHATLKGLFSRPTGAGVAGAGAAAGAAAGGAGAALRSGSDGEHEDMFTSLNRLQGRGASRDADTSAAAAAGAAEQAAAAEALLAEGGRLAAAAAEAAAAVSALAAGSRDLLGDEAPSLLRLCTLLEQALSHGLRDPGSHGAASGLTSWLAGRKATAFGALQALEHGGRQGPRLLLGAEAIAHMQAARGAADDARLRMWLRASLNEQLLGSRLGMLASADGALLAQHYAPQALLLQPPSQARLVAAARQLDGHRFLLSVDAPPGGASAAGAAAWHQPLPAMAAAVVSEFRWPGARPAGPPAAEAGPSAPPAPGSQQQQAAPQPRPQPRQGAAAAGLVGGVFGRRRRTVDIGEQGAAGPMPAIDTGGGVLSPTSSASALSPLSTADDAGAEWWDPVAGLQRASSGESAASVSGGAAAAKLEAQLSSSLSTPRSQGRGSLDGRGRQGRGSGDLTAALVAAYRSARPAPPVRSASLSSIPQPGAGASLGEGAAASSSGAPGASGGGVPPVVPRRHSRHSRHKRSSSFGDLPNLAEELEAPPDWRAWAHGRPPGGSPPTGAKE